MTDGQDHARGKFEKKDGFLSDEFHVYELAWTPDFIETFIDDELVMSVATKDLYHI